MQTILRRSMASLTSSAAAVTSEREMSLAFTALTEAPSSPYKRIIQLNIKLLEIEVIVSAISP